MENNLEIVEILKNILPADSEILKIADYYNIPAVIVSDFDNDKNIEIAVAYKNGYTKDYVSVSMLKYLNNNWTIVDTINQKAIGITDMLSVAAQTPGLNNLVIGWKIERFWSKLDIYKLDNFKLVSVLHDDIYYSRIAVEDIKTNRGRDGIYEFAVWKHDKLDAYNIDVYRLNGNNFVIAKDAYKEYFKSVVDYYKELMENQGVNEVYLYHLAKAESNIGKFKEAIDTLNLIIKLGKYYPSKQEVLDLKKKYEKELT